LVERTARAWAKFNLSVKRRGFIRHWGEIDYVWGEGREWVRAPEGWAMEAGRLSLQCFHESPRNIKVKRGGKQKKGKRQWSVRSKLAKTLTIARRLFVASKLEVRHSLPRDKKDLGELFRGEG